MSFSSKNPLKPRLQSLSEIFFKYKIHWLISVVMIFNLYATIGAGLEMFMQRGQFSSASGVLVGMDAQIQTSVILFALWVIFGGQIRAWGVPIVISLGIELMDARPFEDYVHPFYLNFGLYPDLLVHEFKHVINPAYARIYTAFWIGCVLALMIVFKRLRSLDRLFVTLIFWSVFATAGLFHWVTVKSLRVSFDADREHISMIAEAPDAVFEPMCEYARTVCLRWEANEAVPSSPDFRIDGVIRDLLSTQPEGGDNSFTVSSWMSNLPVERSKDFHIDSHGKPFIEDLGSFSVAVSKRRDGSFRAVSNVTSFERTNNFASSVFGYLSLSAHVVWLLGGILLLLWHKRRRARRARNSRSFVV